MNTHIFRAYDIRGIAIATEKFPKVELTPDFAYQIGKASGTYLQKKYNTKTMVVGRDNRLTSEEIQKSFINGVLETGINVTNLGLTTSPLVYYAICKNNYDSGVNITASHNPKEYNGIKINRQDAHSVCGEELQEIAKIIETDGYHKAEQKGQLTEKKDNFQIYLEDIKKRFTLAKKLKIVIDCGNGVAGIFAKQLFETLGCEVTELYCEPDGNFPNHEANPEDPKNLLALSEKVREQKADLGIGFDGDGDRIGIIDENGKHYSADLNLLFLAEEVLKTKQNQPIIFDVKTSSAVINELNRLGANAVMSKTGHSIVEQRMHDLDAPLAGEISGHMFFGKNHYNYYGFDDAFFAACAILQKLSQTDKTFSQHFSTLPKTETTKEYKLHCDDNKKAEVVSELVQHFTALYNCITLDGVRINFDDTSWGIVRYSNTSPNLTLRFEALTTERLKEIKQIVYQELQKHPVDLNNFTI